MEQTPSIGRVVHYQSYGTPNGEFLPEPRAAIITSVHEATIDAAVLNPGGLFFAVGLQYSEDPKPGCWNWPPRI
jgi:hypothetical protein